MCVVCAVLQGRKGLALAGGRMFQRGQARPLKRTAWSNLFDGTHTQMAVRVTPEQAKLLFGQRSPADPTKQRKVATRRKKEDLPENQVEGQALDFLRMKGWTVTRNQVGTYVPYHFAMKLAAGEPMNHRNVVRIGEAGNFDWTCTRPVPGTFATVEQFHMEVKAPGRPLRTEQREFLERRRILGFVCIVVDNVRELQQWHKNHFGN